MNLLHSLTKFGYIIYKERLHQESKQDTGSYRRTDYTGYIRAHSVHQQVVGWVVFQTYSLRDTSSIGHCRYTGITDKRIDFLFLRKNEVEDFHKEHS